ncbi:hypothetical protein RCJ22_00570, partial [Vibrio sp. FNV 38]|nr:hypothetical protein [Vibrio sp. FNV 38]
HTPTLYNSLLYGCRQGTANMHEAPVTLTMHFLNGDRTQEEIVFAARFLAELGPRGEEYLEKFFLDRITDPETAAELREDMQTRKPAPYMVARVRSLDEQAAEEEGFSRAEEEIRRLMEEGDFTEAAFR